MDAKEKYEYWLDIAQYDLETADAMFNSGRWLYVAFMCQQAVEKLSKGLFVLYHNEEPARTHNIGYVAAHLSGKLAKEFPADHLALFDRLSSMYIEGRYPEYKKKLSDELDKLTTEALLNQTKEVFAWLRTMEL